MNEDQIYRRAYWQGLPGGIVVAALLTLGVGILGASAPRIVMHPILRIAISYGVMWCVLHAMFRAGGGLMGFKVTATAWVLANVAMFAGLLLSPVIQQSQPTGAGLTPEQEEQVVMFLLLMLFLQAVGTTIAGWVHGD